MASQPYDFAGDSFYDNVTKSWLGHESECINAVRCQGGANACYAFPSVDCVFAEFKLFSNHPKKLTLSVLAPQELVDCLPEVFPPKDTKRWDGYVTDPRQGYPNSIKHAFRYIQMKGIYPEKYYPYRGSKGTCHVVDGLDAKVFIDEYHALKEHEVVKRVDLQPVVGRVPFVPSLINYDEYKEDEHGGVYQGPTIVEVCSREERLREGKPLAFHALQVIGYGGEGDGRFYLCKNCWGPDFGHHGHIKVLSKILDRVSYPVGAHIRRVQL